MTCGITWYWSAARLCFSLDSCKNSCVSKLWNSRHIVEPLLTSQRQHASCLRSSRVQTTRDAVLQVQPATALRSSVLRVQFQPGRQKAFRRERTARTSRPRLLSTHCRTHWHPQRSSSRGGRSNASKRLSAEGESSNDDPNGLPGFEWVSLSAQGPPSPPAPDVQAHKLLRRYRRHRLRRRRCLFTSRQPVRGFSSLQQSASLELHWRHSRTSAARWTPRGPSFRGEATILSITLDLPLLQGFPLLSCSPAGRRSQGYIEAYRAVPCAMPPSPRQILQFRRSASTRLATRPTQRAYGVRPSTSTRNMRSNADALLSKAQRRSSVYANGTLHAPTRPLAGQRISIARGGVLPCSAVGPSCLRIYREVSNEKDPCSCLEHYSYLRSFSFTFYNAHICRSKCV